MGNWQDIKTFIEKSDRSVRLFEGNKQVGSEICLDLNIPKNSLLYEIVCNTCGIVIDGWIRILGQPNNKTGISQCNNDFGVFHENIGLFIVATDIVGGLFAININRFEEGPNSIWYFAPDTLEWECLDMKYNEFISWAVHGNIDKFYETMRWKGWEKDVKDVSFEQGLLIYPFLWAKECIIDKADKKVVPFDEIVALNFDYKKRIFSSDDKMIY